MTRKRDLRKLKADASEPSVPTKKQEDKPEITKEDSGDIGDEEEKKEVSDEDVLDNWEDLDDDIIDSQIKKKDEGN